MAEYIEREAAINAVRHAWAKDLEPTQFIDNIPAVDVTEVRHGEWLHNDEYVSWAEMYICSLCGRNAPTDGDYRNVLTDYCPNCGARMDGGAGND